MFSVVIPTYNHIGNLIKCVESVKRTTDLESMAVEIIVVANGCEDGTEDYVRSQGKNFRLLSSPEPLGFIRATNAGIAIAKGEYVVFLNDDTEILDWGKDNYWLKILHKPLDDDPLIALTGSSRDAWARDIYFIVLFCAMTRRRLLIDMGMLDDAFGLGCGEDCDYSLKLQKKGFRISQVPENMNRWETKFPIWHVGHITFSGIQTDVSINTNILENRYPRTDDDREFSRMFSNGLQNCSLWEKG